MHNKMKKIPCYIVDHATQKVEMCRAVDTNRAEEILPGFRRLRKRKENISLRLFICRNEEEGLDVLNDAKTFFSHACYYPPKDIFYYDADIADTDIREERLRVLEALAAGKSLFIVTTMEAALERMDDISGSVRRCRTLRVGDVVDAAALRAALTADGYRRMNRVEQPGELASRGAILDIYGYTMDFPVRIEFFDDEIDSIRYFDPQNQRSVENITACDVILPQTDASAAGKTCLAAVVAAAGGVLIVDEPATAIENADRMTAMYGEELARRMMPPETLADLSETADMFAFTVFEQPVDAFVVEHIRIPTASVPAYQGDIFGILRDVRKWHDKGYAVHIYTASLAKAQRILGEVVAAGMTAVINPETSEVKAVAIHSASIKKSFIYEQRREVFISDTDIFKRTVRHRRKRYEYEEAEAITDFGDLRPGDIVVHEKYGIGRYLGLDNIGVQGVHRDFLKIEYKRGAILHVLATNLDTVQKYMGKADGIQLSDLEGDRWTKRKNRVRKEVEAVAEELVNLYAERASVRGFRFAKDDALQREMEEMFEYVETQDQLDAVAAIKADMESEKVMDRLLCGDVGFGKTEVAMRAAFKAVLSGKQVAVLVPTTVLARQHYDVFTKRFRQFPVNIGMLSRFVSPARQKEVIRAVNDGRMDILIGTHAALGKDIKYRDLGLVIIDEEQRFGVRHKERLKAFKQSVDVLTLSATPIPRTMYMSLSGIRDLSLLREPPYDRRAIRTYVMPYRPETVAEAIRREHARGGQVYFVHNRVENMEETADELRRMLPSLHIATAHGQMNRHVLEDIFADFVNRDIDVLVATTIVETGLDIPNVNTIIINDADRFGLSTLYQLRGRVGRGSRRAYAFLMYQPGKQLKSVAVERLQAIREFSDLGAGTKVAMRDLEIRGAGSLLGDMQSGHIESIGYDLYCKILREAVRKAKGEAVTPHRETLVDLNVDTFIRDDYISDEHDKLEMYKKFNLIRTEAERMSVIDECTDRFGDMPDAVYNTIRIGYLKNLANGMGVTAIRENNDAIEVTFDPSSGRIPPATRLADVLQNPGPLAIRYIGGKDPLLQLRAKGDKLDVLEELLNRLKQGEGEETTG
ncbi:MAG: transcription-repair coupling factor [Eubacteriales bacterium]|nr:transcription-repair coupling factor [Eubacteriales bacterium]